MPHVVHLPAVVVSNGRGGRDETQVPWSTWKYIDFLLCFLCSHKSVRDFFKTSCRNNLLCKGTHLAVKRRVGHGQRQNISNDA